MKILFVHQNFPGQFKHLAPALVAQGHEVTAFVMRKDAPPAWQGLRLVPYFPDRGSTAGMHPWVGDFETKVIRGEAAFRRARRLASEGYRPDLIIAHPGWGESLFLKEVWPAARLGIYCEFFYHPQGADVGFDPEHDSKDDAESCRLRLKNLNYQLHLETADAGLAPTEWQASTFPAAFRPKITVVHDGIDTQLLAPNPAARLGLKVADRTFQVGTEDEVITFVNRNLEPYRGYHIFMRALPEMLRRRPRARVLLVGGDEVSYGAAPSGGRKWKEISIQEVRGQISDADWARVHFLGKIPYEHFILLLQVSTVHVYLTYPFVLSWSLLEAMSAGCAIVASDTAPLHEAMQHDATGRLVGFFDGAGLTREVCALLEAPGERRRLGGAAREFARANFDLQTVCLPRQLDWVRRLAGERP